MTVVTKNFRRKDIVEYIALLFDLPAWKVKEVLEVHDKCVIEILRLGGRYRCGPLGVLDVVPHEQSSAARFEAAIEYDCDKATPMHLSPTMAFSRTTRRVLALDGEPLEVVKPLKQKKRK